MMEKFDRLVEERRALRNWWKLGSKIAKYNQKHYSLRVDTRNPGMVAFCGQNYAGAKNYHEAPEFFINAVGREISKVAYTCAKQAYENEIERINKEIEECREDIIKQLETSKENTDGI